MDELSTDIVQHHACQKLMLEETVCFVRKITKVALSARPVS